MVKSHGKEVNVEAGKTDNRRVLRIVRKVLVDLKGRGDISSEYLATDIETNTMKRLLNCELVLA